MSDKPEEAVKAEQGEKPEKPEKGERPEKAPKGEKGPKGDKGAKADKADKGDKAEKKPKERRPQITPRLKKRYDEEIRPALMKEFGLKNKLEAPRLTRVAINMGLGEAVLNAKIIESAQKELGDICGQKPVVTRARKSIANFKLREGMPIGVMVTLRKEKMWEFVDRLFSFALPRVRDFKGVSPKAFDGRGNYTLGVREQIIFPEIDYDKVEKIKGMNITFVTTAGTDERGRALLAALGMPFRK